MVISPGWYVAICCIPTLVFDLIAAIAIIFPLRGVAVVSLALAPIKKVAIVALQGYALWHFGVFAGLGIVVVSIPCILFTDRSIEKVLGGFIERRVAGCRQTLIHAVLDSAGMVDIELMAATVEELESYDDETLQEIAATVLESEKPAHTLLMATIAMHLDELGYQPDDYGAVLVTSDLQQLSNIRNWLLTDVGILTDSARLISSRLRANSKTRRGRKGKPTIEAKLIELRSEQPGNRR